LAAIVALTKVDLEPKHAKYAVADCHDKATLFGSVAVRTITLDVISFPSILARLILPCLEVSAGVQGDVCVQDSGEWEEFQLVHGKSFLGIASAD